MENDYIRFVDMMKRLIFETLSAGVPSDIVIGEVVSTNPLIIQLENKLPIPAENILLTKNTCEWSMDMTVDHNTEDAAGGGGEAAYAAHHHGYKGRKNYLVHNNLVLGDKVILLRESGGQRFIALDRVYNPNRGCKD
nr:MAG TPA: Protein of unknown function (DUF2577) [Caudoviricetes sp.]